MLDYCAGGGGKTIAMAAMMENKGQIFAHDVDGRRLSALIPRMDRAGIRNVQLRHPKENASLDDLSHKMDLVMIDANAVVDGEPCWLIEQTPRTDEERAETGYSKSQVWVSKDKAMAVQIKSWLTDGRQIKYTRFLDVKSVGGVWFAHRVIVRTVENGKAVSTSVLAFPSVAFGDPTITEDEFTERRMEQGP